MAQAHAGKVAVVSGSRRGLGRLIAEHLLEQGATVHGIARGEASFEAAGYTHHVADVGDAAAVDAVFRHIRGERMGLDYLINNAGVATSGFAMMLPSTAASEMVSTNLLGTFHLSRAAAKLMTKRRTGRIVNIGSIMAVVEPAGGSIYAATKAAIETLAHVLAKELGPVGITCNTLGLSVIETDMLDTLSRDLLNTIVASMPIARPATPADVMNVLDFLLSDASGYITAQTIYLGGLH
jgi:3-oxoacyl-[acyl-carrier protein] reductase